MGKFKFAESLHRLVKHHPSNKLPELPLEIWLRIMLFVPDPKPLIQSQRSLYLLCLNPLSSAKWLVAQYGKDAFYGALWFWCKGNDIWRRWILKQRPSLPFAQLPIKSSAFFVKKAIKTFYKGWFYMSKRSSCKRCNVSSLLESNFLDIQDEVDNLRELKGSLHLKMKEYCQFESFQLRICMILIDEKVEFDDCLRLLLRYAASMGHSKLLNYFLSLSSTQPFDPAFGTEYEIKDTHKESVLELLRQSITAKKVLCVYQCLQTDVVRTLTPEQWQRMMSKIIGTFSISLTRLFIERDAHLRLEEVEYAIKVGGIPFLLRKSKRALRKMSFAMLNQVATTDIMADQAVFGLAVCEAGREDLILLLHERGVTFNHFDGLPLYNAALFGHYKAVKTLLNVCRVNPKIFQTGRITVLNMIIIDHLVLLFALFSSFFAVLNELYCRATYSEGPNSGLFFIPQNGSLTTNFCSPDSHDTTPWSSLLVFGFFLSAYLFLSSFVNIIPLLRCLYMVKRQIERNKKIAPDLESQETQ